MNFRPDIRNIGGRKTIYDILRNHRSKLENMRAVISTRAGTTRRFGSVLEGGSRCSSYKSQSSKNELKISKRRLNKTMMWEHQNNIRHMQRRINDIGSALDRKKNRFDPIMYPAMFLRGNGEHAPELSPAYIHRILKPPKVSRVYSTWKDLECYSTSLTPVGRDKIGLNKIKGNRQLKRH